jgi:hypothetical protein
MFPTRPVNEPAKEQLERRSLWFKKTSSGVSPDDLNILLHKIMTDEMSIFIKIGYQKR